MSIIVKVLATGKEWLAGSNDEGQQNWWQAVYLCLSCGHSLDPGISLSSDPFLLWMRHRHHAPSDPALSADCVPKTPHSLPQGGMESLPEQIGNAWNRETSWDRAFHGRKHFPLSLGMPTSNIPLQCISPVLKACTWQEPRHLNSIIHFLDAFEFFPQISTNSYPPPVL